MTWLRAKDRGGKPIGLSPAPLIRDRVISTSLCVATAALGLLVVGQVALEMARHVAFPYEIDGWAEGGFLHNALCLSRGENFYLDSTKEVDLATPYGFLYPAVVAPLICVFGPKLWPLRSVSALSAVVALVLIFYMARRRAGTSIGGVLGVLLACTTYRTTLGCWDWGHSDSLYFALGLSALVCIQAVGSPCSRWRVLLASIFACASCCAKQTGAGFIVACAISLFLRRRRSALLFVESSGAILIAVLVVGHYLTGGQFERHMILVLGDPYLASKITQVFNRLVSQTPLLVLMGFWQLGLDFKQHGWSDPVLCAVVLVGPASLAAFIKEAGLPNNLMPLLMLLAIPAGVRLGHLIVRGKPAQRVRNATLLLLLGQLAVTLFWVMPDAARLNTLKTPVYLSAGRLIEAELSNRDERVLMGHPISFAIGAGRPVYDSLMVATYPKGYPGVRERLERQITEKSFDKILMPEEMVGYLGMHLVGALSKHYRIDHVIQKDVRLWNYTPMLVFKPVASGQSETSERPRG